MSLLNQVACLMPDTFAGSPWNEAVSTRELKSDADAQGRGQKTSDGSIQDTTRSAGHYDYRFYKSACDYIVSAFLLILLAPLMMAAMLLVRLSSKGSPIYTQKRLGRNGKPFVIYKLRTMRHDCERLTGPQWSTTNDPRVTSVGRFLRKTHLDELPQLLNVLRGEMSLVGPRPERPEIVNQLEKIIPAYRNREAMLPGVTGLAQVQLPPDTDVEDVRRKLACDLYYRDIASLWLDVRIVLSTILKVFCIPCSVSCSILGIPSAVNPETNLPAQIGTGRTRSRMQTA